MGNTAQGILIEFVMGTCALLLQNLGTDFDHLVQLGKEQRKQLSSGYERVTNLINDYVWLCNEMVE